MKFDYIIGNPPYQEETEGNNRATPIYNYFIEQSCKLASKTMLITPARFLFDAGQTPKSWNRQMLSDVHLKVEWYEPHADKVFPQAEIKGGVAVTYHDETQEYEPINVFIPAKPLKALAKRLDALGIHERNVSELVVGAVPYSYSRSLRENHAEWIPLLGKSGDLRTNALDNLADKVFFEVRPHDEHEYVQIYGLYKKTRKAMWVRQDYLNTASNFAGWKVLLPKASGNGDYGEGLAEMIVVGPKVGHTQSFISMGDFTYREEALALQKYLSTKFARALLGIFKVTQDITARVFKYVPLQDFTSSSDIDWSQSVADIDKQLYKKYNLTGEEIDFIEKNVKEMK
nr:Eco57I restriction-modification methylase domain-containing protein [Bifidobacterium thermophilum]